MRNEKHFIRSSLLAGFTLLFIGASASAIASVPLSRLTLQRQVATAYAHLRGSKEAPTLKAVRARNERERIETALLKERWNDPVTDVDLQRALDHAIHHSQAPENLRKIFASLDNDPHLIKEILFRPIVTTNRARSRWATDPALLAVFNRKVDVLEKALQSNSSHGAVARRFNAFYSRLTPVEEKDPEWDPGKGAVALSRESLKALECSLPSRQGAWSRTIRSEGALLSRRTGDGSVEEVFLPRTPYTAWIKEQGASMRNENSLSDQIVLSGGLVKVALPTDPDCTPDTWDFINSENAPLGREKQKAVWTGAEMIVWGGWDGYYTMTGGIYDPALDLWTATTVEDAPTGRTYHRAFWTGDRMLVWGGKGYMTDVESSYKNSGGLYDPATDTWTPTGSENAAYPRAAFFAVWTGDSMIVWGGWDSQTFFDIGGIYHPSDDSWSVTTTDNVPIPRNGRGAVWTGHEMIIWGGYVGFGYLGDGGAYDPAADTWTILNDENAPTARASGPAFWTGGRMIVWGGWTGDGIFTNTGGIYDPASDTWIATNSDDAPAGRNVHTGVWTGHEMIIWGGTADLVTGIFSDGAKYNPMTDTWTMLPLDDGLEGKYYSSSVWTGTRMIIWGGVPYDTWGATFRPDCRLPLLPFSVETR